MSEKQKPRKSNPGQNSEPNWRTRQHCNTSKLKYSRDAVLEKFQLSESFPIPVPEDILVVFLKDSSLPLNSAEKFLHGLGESVNSRKFFSREKTTEKGHVESKKKEENEKKAETKVLEEVKEISEIWDLNETEEVKVEVKASRSEKVLRNKEDSGSGLTRKVEQVAKKETDSGVKKEAEKVNEKIEEVNKGSGKLEKDNKKEAAVAKEPVKTQSEKVNVDLSLKQEVTDVKGSDKKSGKEQPKKLPEPVKVETESLKKPSEQSKSPFGTGKKPSEPLKTSEAPKKGLEQGKKQPEPSKKPQSATKTPLDSVKDQETKPKEPQKLQAGNSNPSNTVQPNPLPSEQSTPKPNSLPPPPQTTLPSSATFPIPSLEKSQLSSLSTTPFAKILLFTGKPGQDSSKLYFPSDLKVYERLWFYKDSQGSTQGPFSCLEMFNWVAKGCFPDSLQIAFCNSEFLPLNNQNPPKKTESPPELLSKKNPWSNSSKLFSRDNNKK